MVMGCVSKSLCDVKVTGSKLHGQKTSRVKGWCGLGWVQSLSDFEDLDALGSQFLKTKFKPITIISENLTKKRYSNNKSRPSTIYK